MADIPLCFARNLGALTPEQQETLGRGRVTVVGCGGLGGHVIELLVRIGVGHLCLVDPDVFSLSNCNRQLHALADTLGRNKAETALARCRAIHPHCALTAWPCDFRSVSVDALQGEVMVDCLDDIQARRELAALCRDHAMPLVHGAVSGWYGQVGVQLPGYDLLAGLYPEHLAPTSGQAPPVLSFSAAMVAAHQACETVKLLLGLPSSLHNSWLHIDLLHGAE